jgi:hypothetical protein
MKRFKTVAQARIYRIKKMNTQYIYDIHVFKIPKKYQKGRHKIKPYAVCNIDDWIQSGY